LGEVRHVFGECALVRGEIAKHRRPPNVPLLSCGRILKGTTWKQATSEPVVFDHGRGARRPRWRRGAAVSFNSLLGGVAPRPPILAEEVRRRFPQCSQRL